MPATSIKLVFTNQDIDPEQISRVLGFQPSSLNANVKANASDYALGKGFESWELLPNDANWPIVESLLPPWISLLEGVQAELKSLSTESLGGYLDVRVYEDEFFVEDDLLSRLGATGIGISVWFNPPEQTVLSEPERKSTITFPDPGFYHCQLDEDHFFRWLQEIEGVIEVRGAAAGLTVYISVPVLSEPALRDLIGLLARYNVPMSGLRSQLTPANEQWFKDPETYWYKKVFVDADEHLS